GNYRLDVVDQLQENPGVVLRRILIPLKQKHKEWVICMKTVQKGATAKDYICSKVRRNKWKHLQVTGLLLKSINCLVQHLLSFCNL
ncbi:unnamed protein product, partial [Musa hybrid cultivar]